eukprot:TRINITY_DN11537_c1_g2_i3.p1 TRINITY_DN11537_c1_g2~~TRINITY_DN11537_c1_g2_i3.p1  ORF type:complete len:698 (+),score=154.98 TRINITY_DN11537_c1_g2_i3:2-2095(+)
MAGVASEVDSEDHDNNDGTDNADNADVNGLHTVTSAVNGNEISLSRHAPCLPKQAGDPIDASLHVNYGSFVGAEDAPQQLSMHTERAVTNNGIQVYEREENKNMIQPSVTTSNASANVHFVAAGGLDQVAQELHARMYACLAQYAAKKHRPKQRSEDEDSRASDDGNVEFDFDAEALARRLMIEVFEADTTTLMTRQDREGAQHHDNDDEECGKHGATEAGSSHPSSEPAGIDVIASGTIARVQMAEHAAVTGNLALAYNPELHPHDPFAIPPSTPALKLPKMLIFRQGSRLPYTPSFDGAFVRVGPCMYEHQRGRYRLSYHRNGKEWRLDYHDTEHAEALPIARCLVEEDTSFAVNLIITHGELTATGREPVEQLPAWECNIGGFWNRVGRALEVYVPTKFEARSWTGHAIDGTDTNHLAPGLGRYRAWKAKPGAKRSTSTRHYTQKFLASKRDCYKWQLPEHWPLDTEYSPISVYDVADFNRALKVVHGSCSYNKRVGIERIRLFRHPCLGELGVFAKANIKKGDIIGWYTGVVREAHRTTPGSRYIVPFYDDEDDDGADPEYKLDVDAAELGNEMRFCNDYRNIAEANNARLKAQSCDYCQHREMAVVAVSDIRQGEEILLDYGDEYWKKMASCSEGDHDNDNEGLVLSPSMREKHRRRVVRDLGIDGRSQKGDAVQTSVVDDEDGHPSKKVKA